MRTEGLEEIIKNRLYNYVKVKTHTNTEFEKNAEGFFQDWFMSLDYFRARPENWGLYPIKDDPLKRNVIWGLLRGRGEKTIVLIHHSDTVDSLDYGGLSELAYRPDELELALKRKELSISQEAREDLDSGDWLFGRAVADMKGGAAIHMALIESYSKAEDFKGNLLFLALPDEENLSAGMRSAGFVLDMLADREGLDYRLMLNSEPHERSSDGSARIYDGSVGKIMPLVYVRGEVAHVGQVYRGLSPINILSEIVRRTELNPDFMEKVGNTTTPPPSWLYMKDRKTVYDVSLPAAAAGYMNMLTLDRAPMEIMERIRKISEEAFLKVIEDVDISYRKHLELAGLDGEELGWEVNVKSYDDIYLEALRDSGERFLKANEATMASLKIKIRRGEISLAEAAIEVIEKSLAFINDRAPLVVVGLAPPYYPNVSNLLLGPFSGEVESIVESLVVYAKRELDYPLKKQSYYTGISDLSYAMFLEDDKNIEFIRNNVIFWGNIYDIPLALMRKLSMPVLNIGPWGKDFHKNSERVLKEDLYFTTPRLLEKTIELLLDS